MNRRQLIVGGSLAALTPSVVAKAATPDERIAGALETLRSAVAEKYPQFEVSCEGGEQLMRYLDGRPAGVSGYHVRLWACEQGNTSFN